MTVRYIHDALFFGGDRELVDATVPMLRAGVARGEAVALVCTRRHNAMLMDALDGDDRVEVLERDAIYRTVPGAITSYIDQIEDWLAAGAPRVRVVGEVDFGDRPEVWGEWCRYESVVNRALEAYPLWTVCAYDTRTIPAPLLDAAEQTHPTVLAAGGHSPNPRYVQPAEYLCRSAPPVPDPIEATPPAMSVDPVVDVGAVRHGVESALIASGATAGDAERFVAAVNEVLTNAILHGVPPVRVRLWSTAQRSLCAVTDGGGGFDDPFAGYLNMSPGGAAPGRGLWLARHFSDAIHTTREADGFTVRIHTYR